MPLKKTFKDVAIVDKTGDIEYINISSPEFFGFKPDEVIGKKFTQLYTNVDENTSTFMRAINHGERFIDYVQILETGDGRTVKQTEDIYLLKKEGETIGAIEFADYDESKDLISARTEDTFEEPSSRDLTLDDIIGESAPIAEFKRKIRRILDKDSPILLMGATGTGKELAAHVIHNSSNRKDHPFVYVNCSALPENLLEGLLFGIKRGSFTDAEEKIGLFQMADKGMLFLDEVDSIPLGIQAKLLRAIEEKAIRPIGAAEEIYLDVRIIAACNRDTNDLITSNALRNDLLFRLSVIQFYLPPLKERGDDVLLLADYYIGRYNKIYKKNVLGISPEIRRRFQDYSWPGNVRELKNLLEGVFPLIHTGIITEKDLEKRWFFMTSPEASPSEKKIVQDYLESGMPLKEYLESYEKEKIRAVLSFHGDNLKETAQSLSISPQLLKYKVEKYFIIK